MITWQLILGLGGLGLGVVVASRRNVGPRLRLAAGLLAVGSIALILYSWLWSPGGRGGRPQDAWNRQRYVLGFGVGQYLKQTHPGRRLAFLGAAPDPALERSIVRGLKDGLAGASPVIAQRNIDLSQTFDNHTTAALFTTQLLTDLKSAGAEIVVSVAGPPTRVDETDELNPQATLELWRSPEYRALQWVVLYPPEPWPPGMFREGRVLAVVREKPQPVEMDKFPAYLEIDGTPAELFAAWFELVTADTGE